MSLQQAVSNHRCVDSSCRLIDFSFSFLVCIAHLIHRSIVLLSLSITLAPLLPYCLSVFRSDTWWTVVPKKAAAVIRAREPRTSWSHIRSSLENTQAELNGSYRHSLSLRRSRHWNTSKRGTVQHIDAWSGEVCYHLHRRLGEWMHARWWSSGSHHHGSCRPPNSGRHTVTASERTSNHKLVWRRERCHALGIAVDCSEQTSGHDSNLLW